MQRILIVNDHYSCILHTPLYYLCQQSIKNLADDVKYKLANPQNQFNGEDFFIHRKRNNLFTEMC